MGNLNKLLNLTLISIVALAFISCSSGSGTSEVSTPEPELQRVLDVSGPTVTVLDVDRYFSMYRYGSTLKFYNLNNENAVIKMHVSNESTDFDPSVEVNIFEESVTGEAIDKWINNQHSDGLYVDVPEPIGIYTLPDEILTVTSYNLVDHSVEEFGDEYDNYVVEISVDNFSEKGVFDLKGFVAETDVHIRTKDIDDQE